MNLVAKSMDVLYLGKITFKIIEGTSKMFQAELPILYK